MRGALQSRLVTAALGATCLVLGVVLITKPFDSLSMLVLLTSISMIISGTTDIAGARAAAVPVLARVVGIGWISLGAVRIAVPEVGVVGLALVVGIMMIVGGAADIIGGFRGTTDVRIASVILGVASVILGALALSWPDVTVLVLAVVFGVRMVVFGVLTMARQFHAGHDEPELDPHPPSTVRRWMRTLAATAALVLALGLGWLSSQLHEGAPVVDAFYDLPDDVPTEPGMLLRSEIFERGIPDGAVAWRILYTTTRNDGEPALASGLVVAPGTHDADGAPVVAWAHGTTGVARACAPSVLEDPFGAGAFFALGDVIDNGWTLVATDYIGLGTEGSHPYLIGQGEARSVLDAVRAARQLDSVSLDERTVVWGHSQGGHAALWTGQIADSYAPDVPLSGVAALAPASDLIGLVGSLADVPGGSIFASYVISAYADTYPDVEVRDYVEAGANITVREIAGRCLAEPAVFVSILSSLATSMSIFTTDPATGPAGERLVENSPTGPISAPLLIAQGLTDPLVLPDVQEAFVDRLCASGQPVDFRTYPGRDHVGVVSPDSPLLPELVTWTHQRLDNETPPDGCPS